MAPSSLLSCWNRDRSAPGIEGNTRNKPEAIKPITTSIQPLRKALSPCQFGVVFVPADHGHQHIDVKHQTSAPGSIFVTGFDGLHHNRAPTLNDQVIGGWHRSVATPPHSAGKARLAHPPVEEVQRQVNMNKHLSSHNVVQISPVSARWDIPRAQHRCRHRRQSARD